MTYQTALLFKITIPFSLYGFVFSGTLTSYNFHWWLSSPTNSSNTPKSYWSHHNKPLHALLAITGLLASIFFIIPLLYQWHWLVFSAFITFLYSAPKISILPFLWLKRIAIAKTIYLAFAWMHVTTLLPILITETEFTNNTIIFAVNRFFFIYAICILFDYRDREGDKKENIRSMITQLTEHGINVLFYSSVLVTSISTLLLLNYWSLPVIIALIIPVLALILLYPSSKKTFSDYRYYFILDGLMMISSPLVVLAKFAG
jgi:4-hydroxybenzoate polyprenyltransferase